MKIYVLGNLLNKRFYEINRIQDFILPIQPKIEIEKVKFEKFGLKNSELMLHLRITNFNTYQVQINKLHYQFKIKDYLSAEGYKAGTVEIKPKQTTFAQIPMQIEMKHVGKMIRELIKNKKKLPFEVYITCKAKAAGLEDPIDIDTKINGIMDLGK